MAVIDLLLLRFHDMSIINKPFKYTFNNATLYIVIANIAVYVFLKMFPGFYLHLAMFPPAMIYNHEYWQVFTYMFVHDYSSLQHIMFNMIGLLMFGISVEKAIGTKEFCLLYFLSGIFCGIFSFLIYLLSGNLLVVMCGASGCLYAILLAYAVIYPKSVISIWGVLPVPAPLLVGIYAVIEVVSQIFSLAGGVAHMTHLAGFLFTWFYFIIRMKINPWKVWKNAYQ